MLLFLFFFFKQKTAYEMRISDWSSDVCSSDLRTADRCDGARRHAHRIWRVERAADTFPASFGAGQEPDAARLSGPRDHGGPRAPGNGEAVHPRRAGQRKAATDHLEMLSLRPDRRRPSLSGIGGAIREDRRHDLKIGRTSGGERGGQSV